MQLSRETARKPIRILPRELAEKIAAGEVIERPASVIKELVENSIDSGATRIIVEISDGGKKLIRVTDNGCGIADAEIHTALERHATSKINALDDLWNLSTMGFRGEALPSIAAISRFTLESRSFEMTGKSVYLEGGKIIRETDAPDTFAAGSSRGTRMSVEDLFFNVPARLKFQRTKSGESSFVREMLEHFALANPRTGFTLVSEGRKSFSVDPVESEESLQSRVADVFDTEMDALEEFHSKFEDIGVHGFLDRNTRAGNSKSIFLCVNGRIVKDKLLQQAVITALRPRMMEGEYPRIFMNVTVNAGDVDVNVHPTKSEVRFRRSRDVFQVVHGVLSRLAIAPSKPFYDVTSLPALQSPPAQESNASFGFTNDKFTFKTKTYTPSEAVLTNQPQPEVLQKTPLLEKQFSSMHYIGQLKNTYLLFQDDQGLVLIDQHAAHERINYERLRTRFITEGLNPQPLLVSITVKCRPEDILVAQEFMTAFERLGFEVEVFGDDCLLLRSLPEGLDTSRAQELFRGLLAELKDAESAEVLTKDPSRLSPRLERMLSTTACHSSVRAGQSLSPHEAHGLTAAMAITESALNCPHGRPASIRMSFQQIENLFKR